MCTTTIQGWESLMQARIGEGHRMIVIITLHDCYFHRFENLLLKDNNLIMYIGGNTMGADGIPLMKLCPKWYRILYSSIPCLHVLY